VAIRVDPLRLEAFEQLPKHARRCVFWEVDPQTLSGESLADPEFEKEAWLSMVMLEWGSCGQIATDEPAEDGEQASAGDGNCRGYVLYAPPRAVPRASRFPTGPVSADAVLLTSMGTEPGQTALPEMLIAHVVNELIRRGVRALEAFGRTAAAAELLGDDPDPRILPAVAALGDCSFETCMIDAEFLQSVGFAVVAPHRYFPRLRLELDKGLGWKAEVEAALERLLERARLEQPVGTGPVVG
jgi:hypothetical protein